MKKIFKIVVFNVLIFTCTQNFSQTERDVKSKKIRTTEIDGNGKILGYFYATDGFRIVEGDTINVIDEEGLLQGEWERLHPEGSWKCRGVYVDSRKDGFWERKYENGNYYYQLNYKKGLLHGYAKFYNTNKNGKLKKEGNYQNGKMHGTIKSYNDKGFLVSLETYNAGIRDGQCKYYNEEGILLREGNMKDDVKILLWKFYDNGVLKNEVEFDKEGTYKGIKVINEN